MRRVLLGAALVTASAAISGGPALGARPIKTGCPSAYEAMSLEDVLSIATPGFEDAIRAEDANGDETLCVKLLPGPIPLFEPTFLYYDNNRVPERG